MRGSMCADEGEAERRRAVSITIRLPHAAHARILKIPKNLGVPITNYMREAIMRQMEKDS